MAPGKSVQIGDLVGLVLQAWAGKTCKVTTLKAVLLAISRLAPTRLATTGRATKLWHWQVIDYIGWKVEATSVSIFSVARERSVWNRFGVGHVPTLCYNLISLAKIVKARRKYYGDDPGLTVHYTSREDPLCPVVGDTFISYGRRVDGHDIEHARDVIAPGLLPTTDVDVNQYHRTTAHPHTRLLSESARQQGVKLTPGVKLLPCVACSTAKGFSTPVKKTTECRSDKKHGRVFVDLSGMKPVPSMGWNAERHDFSG